MNPFFEAVDINDIDQTELDSYPHRNIQQSLPWLKFIAHTQGAEPLIAALKKGNATLGYFTGLTVKRFGFKILGSPFPGWSTTYMGFNLQTGISRFLAIKALTDFAFNELECDHLEFMDRWVTTTDYLDLDFETFIFEDYEIDLTPSVGEIFANMKPSCRNAIRKAEKSGVIIEEAHDAQFAEDYYSQLKHVFAVKRLIPPFRLDRVTELIKFIEPTGGLLMLRARNQEGTPIATGIFVAMGATAFYWGQASRREYADVRPNEAVAWYAMKYWKDRGVKVFDLVGTGPFKKKFGGRKIAVPWVRKSKTHRVAFLRRLAETIFLTGRRVLGKLLTPPASGDEENNPIQKARDGR